MSPDSIVVLIAVGIILLGIVSGAIIEHCQKRPAKNAFKEFIDDAGFCPLCGNPVAPHGPDADSV